MHTKVLLAQWTCVQIQNYNYYTLQSNALNTVFTPIISHLTVIAYSGEVHVRFVMEKKRRKRSRKKEGRSTYVYWIETERTEMNYTKRLPNSNMKVLPAHTNNGSYQCQVCFVKYECDDGGGGSGNESINGISSICVFACIKVLHVVRLTTYIFHDI